MPSATAPPTPARTRDATFEADVTIPYDTAIQAGGAFVKTWRIRNAGTCDWDARYPLAFVDGVVHWERDDPALRVRNGMWSGHIDFLIEECAGFSGGAIIIPTYLYYRSWSNWVRHTPPP